MISKIEDKDLLKKFNNIFERGKKDSTYKFALARFLVDYCSEPNPKTHVTFLTIAEYFLEYFWPQVCRSNLKHNGHNETQPVIITCIKNHFRDFPYRQNYYEIKKTSDEKIKICIEELSNPKLSTFCFNHVTYALQRIGNDFGKGTFFSYKKDGNIQKHLKVPPPKIVGDGIDITLDALKFFKEYNFILKKIIILEWSKFLEKHNLSTPKIIEKTEGGKIERDAVKASKFRKSLLDAGYDSCFYNESHDLKKMPLKEIHADHVIPFDYIREDEIWNYVLACQKCNCKKSSYLPPRKFIENLIKRNCEKYEKIKGLEKSVNKLGEVPDKTIKKIYENALDDGFKLFEGNFT